MSKNVALAFKRSLIEGDPLIKMGEKKDVYKELLQRCSDKGWNPYIVSTSTYLGNGIFKGFFKYSAGEFTLNLDENIKLDLVYDRSGGRSFPVENDSLMVVDNRDFKWLAWDKLLAYQLIGQHMPKTIKIENKNDIENKLSEIPGELVVLKPHNGLKGLGIYIGPKKEAENFELVETGLPYLMQEFVETKAGIPGIINDRHDLRVVIINKKIVWSHVRIPMEGSYKANVAREGHLKEIDVSALPQEVVDISQNIAEKFYNEYDNPIYSIDFGFGETGKPYVFEINDQIGFPRMWMKAKDTFLEELVLNFASKM